VTIYGFWLVIGFIEHLQIVTTSNYSATANSHILQFTRARINSSQFTVSSPVVAWWHISTISPASVFKFLPPGGCLTTKLTHCSSRPAYDISAWTAQKRSFLSCCFQMLACKRAWFRSRCSVTVVVLAYPAIVAQQRVYMPQYILYINEVDGQEVWIWLKWCLNTVPHQRGLEKWGIAGLISASEKWLCSM
jgi:hypothetical protein